MKTSFPACKANGEQYATLDEMMGMVGREPHGSWLAGTNRMWHGGLHISQVSAPGSVMTAETVDTVVPLQCMADGEVVAWRLGQEYKENSYNGQTLQYSTTFVLVKSTCLPDKDKPQTQLDFYSLYMGLAPLSAFQKCRCMKAKTKVKTRKAGNYESSQGAGGPAPAPAKEGDLAAGSRVLILKEMTFMNGADEQPFGLAQKLDSNGNVTGKTFWVTLLPEFMTEDGEQYAHLPVWMQQAVTAGTFDTVGKPAEKLEIKAGDAIGFLGDDIVPAGMGQVSRSTYAHIEVLSTDSRMPAFLDNPGAVTAGQKYIRVKPESLLYTNSGDTFTQTSAKVGADIHSILPTDKCSPKESGGKKYYQISEHSWLSQDEVEEFNQYDLKKLGFTALVQESTPDMSMSLMEEWVSGVFTANSEQVVPERGIRQQQVSDFYRAMVDRLDSDQNGELSGMELYNAVHHPEMGIRDIAARMVVKHESEWFGGSSAPKWTKFFETYDPVRVGFAKKWLDDVEWMSQVEPFTSGSAVWHMHPVVFLDVLTEKFGDTIDFQTSLGIYKISKKSADLILKAEGYQSAPYVPQGSNASGVTIGYGYDLGQQTVAKMREMLSGYFTEPQLILLENAIGLKGSEATAVIPSLRDVLISKEDAVGLAMKMKAKYAQIVVDTYPEVLETHPHCQGAMLSLVINRGTSFDRPSVASRVEMKNIHDDFVSNNLNDIPTQFRSMKRLWVGKGLDGLITRREDEAKLFEEGLAQ